MERSFIKSLLASILVLAFVSAVMLTQGKAKVSAQDVSMRVLTADSLQR